MDFIWGGEMMDSRAIGQRIKKFRKTKVWTQENLAERLGMSVAYVGMLERGVKIPKLQTLVLIANTLDVSADQLLADVLDTGYTLKTSEYIEPISQLSADDRERIFEVLDTMLKHNRKRT